MCRIVYRRDLVRTCRARFGRGRLIEVTRFECRECGLAIRAFACPFCDSRGPAITTADVVTARRSKP
jgi:hypothetical protein